MRICPSCNSKDIRFLFERKNVPIKQNEPLVSEKDAKNVKVSNLEIYICCDCTFVFNAAFNASLITYTEKYNNNQLYSNTFTEHINELIESVGQYNNLKNKSVIEIGCGKGDFIKRLSNKYKENQYYGFDTTYEGPLEYSSNLTFYQEYFNKKYKGFKSDFIFCRHVIEHISNPKEFLESLKETIQETKGVKLFFETPTIEWIFQNNAFWDFFYEHCSYFSAYSLEKIIESVGFNISKVETVFEGQYLWLECSEEKKTTEETSLNNVLKLADEYCLQYNQRIEHWHKKIENLSGKVAIWGAGAKGVTFLNMIDLNSEHITYVVDINPMKQNKFIPVTGHKIIAPEQITSDIELIIVMNPNYLDEIRIVVGDKIKLEILQ